MPKTSDWANKESNGQQLVWREKQVRLADRENKQQAKSREEQGARKGKERRMSDQPPNHSQPWNRKERKM